MRLMSYINESKMIESAISKEIAIDLLRKNCHTNTNIIKSNGGVPPIFRGMRQSYDYLKFTGKIERKSANTSNHYTILFSELLDSWKNIAKRNKSLICTTNKDTTDHYGIRYVIIPYDGTEIYTANTEDFWDIIYETKNEFKKACYFYQIAMPSLSEFNRYFQYSSIKDTKSDLSEFLNSTIDEILNNDKYDTDFKNINKYMAQSYLNISHETADYDERFKKIKAYDLYNKYLSPEAFKIKKYSFLQSYNIEISEVWFDKPAVIIKASLLDEILKEI